MNVKVDWSIDWLIDGSGLMGHWRVTGCSSSGSKVGTFLVVGFHFILEEEDDEDAVSANGDDAKVSVTPTAVVIKETSYSVHKQEELGQVRGLIFLLFFSQKK